MVFDVLSLSSFNVAKENGKFLGFDFLKIRDYLILPNNFPVIKMEKRSPKTDMQSSTNNDPDTNIGYGVTRDLRSDVNELKSALKQIQKEQVSSTATLGGVDDAFKEVWKRIRGLDAALPNLVTLVSLDVMKQDFVASLDKLQKLMDANQENFRCSLGLSLDAKLDQIYSWFHQVEDTLKTKQLRLFSQLESLAQECDLAALRENVREDFIHFEKRLDHLDEKLKLQYASVKSVKIENTLTALVSLFCGKRSLSVKESWRKWENFVSFCRQMKEIESMKARTMRKLMLRTCFGRKEKAWKTWLQLIHDKICVEKRRNLASGIVVRALQRHCSLSLKGALQRWHRLSIWERRMALYQEPMYSSKIEQFHVEHPHQAESKCLESTLQFRLAMSSLKKDNEGAILVLSNELCNIRSRDLISIVKEIRSVDQILHSRIEGDVQLIQNDFHTLFMGVEEKIAEGALKSDGQIAELNITAQGIQNHLLNFIHEAETVDEVHTQQIQSTMKILDTLLSKEKVMNNNIEEMNEALISLDRQSRQLQTANHHLEDKLRKHEEMINQMKVEFQILISQLQSKVTDQLITNADHSKITNRTVDSLDSLKMDFMQLKINIDERFDGITNAMTAYGIRKPSMRIIIDDCLAYEKLSKEKNYNVSFNRISIDEVDIDLASDIASFAHDYATWIAFQVDNEVLQSIIVGQNPDDLVYANDEGSEKRNILVAKLRSRLEKAVGEAYPHAGVQRMEARMKFISRVVEATETSLSKYDQIVVPISARLAKVRASVPTCMACDRPLRMKERSTPQPQTSGSYFKAGVNNHSSTTRSSGVNSSGKCEHGHNIVESMESKTQMLNCILAADANTNSCPLSDTDSTNYVLRGGFKMPLAHRT